MSATRLRITTPSRLHFGLLAWGEGHARQFGSVGLMIADPGLAAEAIPSDRWSASGPLASRAEETMRSLAVALEEDGRSVSPFHLAIDRAPPEHVGLGTGTQLSLAVARLVLAAAGEPTPSTVRLADLTGRGRRSGIGLHGFSHGGLIVDGGRSVGSAFPPLLSRIEIPADWSVLVVVPPLRPGLAGHAEREAFTRLPAVPSSTVDYLCRVVLLGLLPAAVEGDLRAFGSALSDLQREVGQGFAPAQGGLFAHPRLERITSRMQDLGLVGVGQSSWGPSLFGLTSHDPDREAAIARDLRAEFQLDPSSLFWTGVSNTGARLLSPS
jgi:beta-RFAP synthase